MALSVLHPLCANHARCEGFGRPIDPATGSGFNCCLYIGDNEEEAPRCGGCDEKMFFVPHLGFQCANAGCDPKPGKSSCSFCGQLIATHRGMTTFAGGMRCKNFNPMPNILSS